MTERLTMLEAMREETAKWTTDDRESSLAVIDEAIAMEREELKLTPLQFAPRGWDCIEAD